MSLADNSISDYGMNAIKSIINHTTVTHLNLASNMISQAGLEMVLDDLMKNNVLKSLDVINKVFFPYNFKSILAGSLRRKYSKKLH